MPLHCTGTSAQGPRLGELLHSSPLPGLPLWIILYRHERARLSSISAAPRALLRSAPIAHPLHTGERIGRACVIAIRFRTGGAQEMLAPIYMGTTVTVVQPEMLRARLAELCATTAEHHNEHAAAPLAGFCRHSANRESAMVFGGNECGPKPVRFGFSAENGHSCATLCQEARVDCLPQPARGSAALSARQQHLRKSRRRGTQHGVR